MKIKLNKGRPVPQEELKQLESELGFPLSEPFRIFVSRNDGAEPETNIFKVNQETDGGVNRFIPVRDIAKERRNIENLPSKAYPIAWAEGGNYVFVDDGNSGKVFFWDHEEPEIPTKVADNFDAFLSILEPFDAKSIELKPGQVKRAWIDPDLLKKLKK
jgi:hypothetical protein